MDKDMDKDMDKKTLLSFLDNLKRDTGSLVNHFDQQTNILIAINVAILAISLSNIRFGAHDLSFGTLGILSALSIVVGLFAIHPPKKMRGRQGNEDVFYNKRIVREGEIGFAETIKNTLATEDEIVAQYSKYFFNMLKHFYRPKRKLFKLSRGLLMLGIIAGLILYIAESAAVI